MILYRGLATLPGLLRILAARRWCGCTTVDGGSSRNSVNTVLPSAETRGDSADTVDALRTLLQLILHVLIGAIVILCRLAWWTAEWLSGLGLTIAILT